MSKDVNAQLILINLFFIYYVSDSRGELKHHGSRKLGTTKGRTTAGRNSKVQMGYQQKSTNPFVLTKGEVHAFERV